MSEDSDSENVNVGIHTVDATPVNIGGDTEQITFDIRAEAVFDQLAQNIYASQKAAIRETLTNSVTAIEKSHDDIDGEITYQVHLNDDTTELWIRDNGIGMTEQTIKDVLSVIGRSTARDDGRIAGQFGMGFLSMYKLVPDDASFKMYTRSRKTDSIVQGVWRTGGFAWDDENVLPDRFAEDDYGTLFCVPLKNEITISDIHQWVEKYGEWAREKVTFELVGSGTIIESHSFPSKNLQDCYDNLGFYFENEYVELSFGPEVDNTVLLLDVPIEISDEDYIPEKRWRHGAIRLKNEGGIVVDGPHEGLLKATDPEYLSMDDSRKQAYVPESELKDEDVVSPQPSGTRSKLESAQPFWNWIEQKQTEVIADEQREMVKYVSENPQQTITEFTEKQYELFENLMPIRNTSRACRDALREINKEDTEITHLFSTLLKRVEIVKDTPHESPKTNKWVAYKAIRKFDEIYMGATFNEQKANIVWNHSDRSAVALVDSDDYEELEELGWKYLKKIRKSRLEQFDISEDVKEKYLEETDKTRESEEITLRTSSDSVSVTTEILQSEIQGEEATNLEFTEKTSIIVFPQSAETQITDHHELANYPDIYTLRCSNQVYDKLVDNSCVQSYSDYTERTSSFRWPTSEGVHTLEKDKTYVFHVVSDKNLQLMRQPAILESAGDIVKNPRDWELGDIRIESAEIKSYIPITYEQLTQLYPFIESNLVINSVPKAISVGETVINHVSLADIYYRAIADSLTPEVAVALEIANEPHSDVSEMRPLDSAEGLKLAKLVSD